jgi:hypothetical protein
VNDILCPDDDVCSNKKKGIRDLNVIYNRNRKNSWQIKMLEEEFEIN